MSPPDTTAAGAFHSFALQLRRRAEVSKTYIEPSEAEFNKILYYMLNIYKPARWTLPDNWDTRENFEIVVRNLEMTSSPGIPYCKEQPTIGKWLKWNGVTTDAFQLERLWHDVNLVINGEWKHEFRVFVKQELHSQKKAKEGRWRLITAAALPVQVVWHMLFRYQNQKFLDTLYETPSFQGFVAPGGGWKKLYRYMKYHKLNYCLDKSSWDVNAPGWVFRLALMFRKHSCKNNNSPAFKRWERVAEAMYKDAYFDAVLTFPDGRRFQQTFLGFQKSGVVNTISDNSLMQVGLHAGACIRLRCPITPIIATGDDTAQQEPPEGYIAVLEELGCVVKEVVRGYQFMGFDHKNFTPMYPHKHIANAFHQKREFLEETIGAYLHWYVHHPYYERWVSLAMDLGLDPGSRFSHEYWLDNPQALDD